MKTKQSLKDKLSAAFNEGYAMGRNVGFSEGKSQNLEEVRQLKKDAEYLKERERSADVQLVQALATSLDAVAHAIVAIKKR